MTKRNESPAALSVTLDAFSSPTIDAIRAGGNVLRLPGGTIFLPREFGFCRGVERALKIFLQAADQCAADGKKLFLLGQIIHNPWVNAYFADRGVQILDNRQKEEVEKYISADDVAVIPAFGVLPEIRHRLEKIGCRIIDSSCPDVRRLWIWSGRAVEQGFGVLIYGRADHDETIVTRSLLAQAGGKYLLLGKMEQVEKFCRIIADGTVADLSAIFPPDATNCPSIGSFEKLAQISQTTMLYDHTIQIHRMLREAFERRFGASFEERLLLQPSVCRATQQRQASAIELCQQGLDMAVVIGGFGSSNTRHLYELAAEKTAAFLVEDARSIISADELLDYDTATSSTFIRRNWLPENRPIRIGILAGASSPEIVVGQVIDKLAAFLK